MGTQPDFDENVGKILPIILMAICKKQKLQITYTDNFGNRSEKKRVPLMVVVHQGEIYIACVSENHPDRTYALKLRRVESAKLLRESFTENPKVLESLRKRIRLGSFLLGEQNPKAEKVVLYFPNYLKNILKENKESKDENIELLDDEVVKNFVGEYEPENYLLNPKETMAVGPYAITDYYMEAKRNQAEGMKNAVAVVKEVADEDFSQ